VVSTFEEDDVGVKVAVYSVSELELKSEIVPFKTVISLTVNSVVSLPLISASERVKTKAMEESLVVEPSETPAVGLVIVIVGVPTKLLFSKEEKDNDRRDAIDK
jgi:hypothetical protein